MPAIQTVTIRKNPLSSQAQLIRALLSAGLSAINIDKAKSVRYLVEARDLLQSIIKDLS